MAEPRAFVCGHPIAHSRSPRIHRYWLSRLGIAGSYERIDVAPAELENFMRGLRAAGFAGGNVTLPHKETVFALIDDCDEAARRIGAVNTLWFEDDRLWGGNTDASGYSAHLDAATPTWRNGRTAVILGAGGAARAVIHALQSAGYDDIRIVNRTRERAEELVARFSGGTSAHDWASVGTLLTDADLLVNTSVLGMTGKPPLDLDIAPLPSHAIVSDIVYAPLRTALLAAAERRGLATADGLGMLLHQAVPGFERWFGVRPEVTPELRRHVLGEEESGS